LLGINYDGRSLAAGARERRRGGDEAHMLEMLAAEERNPGVVFDRAFD
jgi:hypothetical protein